MDIQNSQTVNMRKALCFAETRQIFRTLNPIGSEMDILISDQPSKTTQFHFTPDIILDGIRQLPHGSAAGASGWTYQIIRQLFASGDSK